MECCEGLLQLGLSFSLASMEVGVLQPARAVCGLVKRIMRGDWDTDHVAWPIRRVRCASAGAILFFTE